jgi:hypothetical protein
MIPALVDAAPAQQLNAPKIEPERLEFYNKISGYYKAGEKWVLFIYVHNNNLFAKWKHNPEGAIMQPTGTRPERFTLRGKDGETYHLTFVMDDENKTIKCLIQNEKLELETTKVNNRDDFLTTVTPFPGPNYRIRWSRIADFPVRLSELAAFAMNDSVYVIGGKITNDNSDLADNKDVDFTFAYDPGTNTWTRRADMPTARYDVALISLGDRLYAISSTNESYHPESNTWRSHAPLPHGGAHLRAAASDGRIFVFSAEGPEYHGQNMAYDPRKDVWLPCAPIPTPRVFNAVAALDGLIYVFGGFGYDEKGRLGPMRHEVEAYDPAKDAWRKMKPMPDGIFGAGAACAFDGKVFLIGVWKEFGSDTRDPAGEIHVYDPRTDSWSRTTDLPHGYGSMGATILGDRVYVIGGHDAGFRQFSDAWAGTITKSGPGEN